MANVYNNVGLPAVYSDLASNLKLLWDFSDGGSSTTVTDKSDNDLDGTLNHGSTGDNDSYADIWTNGGTAGVNFDGTNDDIVKQVSNFGSTHYTGTIECWFILDSTANSLASIFSSGDEATTAYYMNIRYNDTSPNNFLFNLRYGSSSSFSNNFDISPTEINANIPYHMVVGSTGAAYFVYLNNIQQTLNFTAGSNNGHWFADIGSTRDNISVGSLKRGSTILYFPGSFYKLAIYDTALSSTQIGQLYEIEKKLINKTSFSLLNENVGF